MQPTECLAHTSQKNLIFKEHKCLYLSLFAPTPLYLHWDIRLSVSPVDGKPKVTLVLPFPERLSSENTEVQGHIVEKPKD